MFCCTHSFKVINPVMILKIFTLKLFYFSNPKLPKNKHIGETNQHFEEKGNIMLVMCL